MPEEPTPVEDETPPGGVMVPPIMVYEPEPVEPNPDPEPEPMTPPSEDGSPIDDGPSYPVPGEVTD
ncbi:hypothetical protein AB0E81_11420 [Streptomyces sp. NPDC033538]|uniref:hypothetical protein n=1 Tax=Streptomyces sp. NPDC033538 TaxID=3155367 RepID=UPI0033C76FFF